jgi:hypothetical protein
MNSRYAARCSDSFCAASTFIDDGPDKTQQLASDRRDHYALVLSFGQQLLIALMQPLLCFPRDLFGLFADSSVIASPASRRATNCNLSSMTEHSFQGITPSSLEEESVTHVFGTIYYLCLRPLIGARATYGSLGEYGSEKAGVGGSTPSLATKSLTFNNVPLVLNPIHRMDIPYIDCVRYW